MLVVRQPSRLAFLAPFLLPNEIADAAPPLPIVTSKCKRMPLLAMRLARLFGGRRFAAQVVNSLGYRFKVRRIHASPVPTEMVKSESIWNVSMVKPVAEDVGPYRRVSGPIGYEPVSIVATIASPFPAAAIVHHRLDRLPKTLYESVAALRESARGFISLVVFSSWHTCMVGPV